MTFPFQDKGYIEPQHLAYALQNGISEQNAKQRYYTCGWSLEDALTIPIGERRPTRITKWLPVALQNNICEKTYRWRVWHGWEPEVAATTPVKAQKHEVFSKEEIEEAARNGISYPTLSARVKRLGWTKRQAITTPPERKFSGAKNKAV